MANQNDQNRSDIIIENNVASWDINLLGDINGTYVGTFKFRCYLTPTQQIAANREYRELIGPHPTFAPEHESFLAYALTQLKYRILSAPPFWNSVVGGTPGDIPDENVLTAILDAAVSAETKYRGLLKKRTESAINRSKSILEKAMSGSGEEEVDDVEDLG